MNINLQDIFKTPTHLHLLIWNRFDKSTHELGLNFLKELLNIQSPCIMPLIRPLGRKGNKYKEWTQRGNDQFFTDNSVNSIPKTSDFSGYTLHCELWIQVSDSLNPAITKKLEELTKQNPLNFFVFWDCTKPIWQPLSSGIVDCPYTEINGDADMVKTLSTMNETDVATLMKTIWFRATDILCKDCYSNGRVTLVSANDYSKHIKLIKNILEELDLQEFGLIKDNFMCDPSRIGASHLSLYSVNAFIDTTQINHPEPLERIYTYKAPGGGAVTRPHKFNSKSDYLDWLDLNKQHLSP